MLYGRLMLEQLFDPNRVKMRELHCSIPHPEPRKTSFSLTSAKQQFLSVLLEVWQFIDSELHSFTLPNCIGKIDPVHLVNSDHHEEQPRTAVMVSGTQDDDLQVTGTYFVVSSFRGFAHNDRRVICNSCF